jgi:polysaccharide export outer membrane protein
MTDKAVAVFHVRRDFLVRFSSASSLLLLAMVGLAALLLSGCATRGGSVPYDKKSFGVPDAASAMPQPASYRIGPLDTLTIAIFRVPDLSGDVQVNEAGKFTLPLIGEIEAGGKTTDELAAYLKGRLSQRFLQDPEVQVMVKASVSQKVTVEGAVTQPGIYPIAGKTSLLQAVALARGTDEDANPRRVVIFRQIEGKRQAAAFDLVSIRRGQMGDPEVFGNDIIVVDDSKSRSLFNDFLRTIPAISIFRPF